MSQEPQAPFDPKELIVPTAMGYVAGMGIVAVLIAIALVLHLPMSLTFGIPNH